MSCFDVLQSIYAHQNVNETKQKGIIFGKKLSRKFSNTLFRELERYYGIKFLQTGEIYRNQSLRKKFVDFYLRLFQIRMTVEVETLTQVLKFSS